jgi:hypothetical protein
MQTRTRRVIGALQCHLGFGVDDAQRHRVEVRAHAVHTEADHAEILLAPVEGPIEVAHLLPSAIFGARHVVEEVRRGEAQKGYTTLELMPQTYRLMLPQVENIIWVIVPFEELGEAE